MFTQDPVFSKKAVRYEDNKISSKYLSKLKKVRMKNEWMEYINKKENDIQTKIELIQDYLQLFTIDTIFNPNVDD